MFRANPLRRATAPALALSLASLLTAALAMSPAPPDRPAATIHPAVPPGAPPSVRPLLPAFPRPAVVLPAPAPSVSHRPSAAPAPHTPAPSPTPAATHSHTAAPPASRAHTRAQLAPALTTAASARAYARAVVAAAQWPCLDALWQRESGWNPAAHNPVSGSHGVPQALPGSKMARYGADWPYNARTQIRWGLRYIAAHYGTPCGAWNFWQSHRWY